ncbi:MAG: hypothetical protein Q8O01_02145 [Candidatus Omnitrophota bacterium]|nr:hypothetical protein [Candidatus Omnitrophota bacterium]
MLGAKNSKLFLFWKSFNKRNGVSMFHKIISSIALIAFLLNIAIQDPTFAQSLNYHSADTLATPLMCGDLAGIERSDMGRIKLELEKLLLGNTIPDNAINTTEKTIPHPADMLFFEREQIGELTHIKCYPNKI